jgi:hypothetical protein
MIKFTDDQLTIQRLSDKINDLEIELAGAEKDVNMLAALEVAGVDNWEGYDEALIEYENAKG